MATIANIKGYINGTEWGVYEEDLSLLTYEEIVAMTYSNALTELNASPIDYYNKFNNENHIVVGGSTSAVNNGLGQNSFVYNFTDGQYYDPLGGLPTNYNVIYYSDGVRYNKQGGGKG